MTDSSCELLYAIFDRSMGTVIRRIKLEMTVFVPALVTAICGSESSQKATTDARD
jgi:hypothetical protein